MHTKNNRIFKALVLIAALILLIVGSKTITSVLRARLVDWSAPLARTPHAFFSAVKRVIPFASFREENRLLRGKVSLLTRQLEEAKALGDENARLRTLLEFKKTIPYTVIPAQVIGRDPSNWSNSLIIDKGLTGGIRQNKAALSTKGLAGRVLEVGRYSAKILLITDPNSKVGVVIQRNRQGGILVGRPDGKCKMIYIALDADVIRGDKVITAGFGSVFPKDIPVGEVVGIGKESGRLYKYAIIKPEQDLSKLEEVLCIR